MKNRADSQYIWRPSAVNGTRIVIDGASNLSPALPLWKKVNIWASKACWITIGDAASVAVQPVMAGDIGAGGVSFPLPAGGTYEWTPQGTNDRYVAVIEDAAEAAVTGFLFIGQAEA